MANESERITYRISVLCLRCGNDTFIVESFRDGQPMYACALCGGDPEVFIHLPCHTATLSKHELVETGPKSGTAAA